MLPSDDRLLLVQPFTDMLLFTAATKTLPMGNSKRNSATTLLRGKARTTFENGATLPPAYGAGILAIGVQNRSTTEITTVLATIRSDYTQILPRWGNVYNRLYG
jgi:hypothetical protein